MVCHFKCIFIFKEAIQSDDIHIPTYCYTHSYMYYLDSSIIRLFRIIVIRVLFLFPASCIKIVQQQGFSTAQCNY